MGGKYSGRFPISATHADTSSAGAPMSLLRSYYRVAFRFSLVASRDDRTRSGIFPAPASKRAPTAVCFAP
jgi:hypothetical protein